MPMPARNAPQNLASLIEPPHQAPRLQVEGANPINKSSRRTIAPLKTKMNLLPSPFVGTLLLAVWCLLLGAPPAAAVEQESSPSYLTSIYQVSPGNGRRFLIGTGAIVHSSDRALIVLGTADIDFWEGDRVFLSDQDEEMTVRHVYDDDFGPPLLVLGPLRNPSAVRPIGINVDRINPGDKFAAVGFDRSGKARQYGVSALSPRECAVLPHVRSSSFVFDQGANICVDNAKSVGSAFDGDALGGPLLVRRGRNGNDYLVGLSPPDAPSGVFESIARHSGWVRHALGQILNPQEEAY